MKAHEAILFVESGRPVRAAKIVYHAEPAFAARLRPPVEIGAIEVTKHIPFRFHPHPTASGPPEGADGRSRSPATSARRAAPRPRRAPVADPFAQLDFDRLIAPAPGDRR